MKMTYRWYGESNEPIPFKYFKQIPNYSGIMGVLD
jgi:D-mannonate dehydratase